MKSFSRLFRWQCITIAVMLAGYGGYYLCRSDFSVALPLMISDLSRQGVSAEAAKVRLGTVASFGVLAYAAGKLPSGVLADLRGGRRNFLLGMAGSVLFTVMFAVSGTLPLFTLAWVGNRLVQSLGWVGMIKITSKWFSFSSYGTVMGIISLSFLFGDAAARQFLATLIAHGIGWHGLFFSAAGALGFLLLLNTIVLKESPRQIGLAEPSANPENLFDVAGEQDRVSTFRVLLGTFARSWIFWLICLLSLGLTLLRETFNLWTPTYFSEALGFSPAKAAQSSALFPLFGGASVLIAGFWSDRLGRTGRAAILACGLLATASVLWMLSATSFGGPTLIPVFLVALIGLLMLGPYSYLAGAISLDFGGKQGSATAAGLIDGVGYIGGVMAGNGVASLSVAWGWAGAFRVLALIALFSSAAGCAYYLIQVRQIAVNASRRNNSNERD